MALVPRASFSQRQERRSLSPGLLAVALLVCCSSLAAALPATPAKTVAPATTPPVATTPAGPTTPATTATPAVTNPSTPAAKPTVPATGGPATGGPATGGPATAGIPAGAAIVVNYAQLVDALTARKVIVVADTFYLKGPMPNITWAVDIRGHPNCTNTELGMCRIDARRRSRHFVVDKGGVLSISGVQLSRGRPATGSGGSVWVMNGGKAIVKDVYFRFNGMFGVTTSGGAIQVDNGGSLDASRCHFIRNFAGFGGAVSLASGARLVSDGCVFHRNLASMAGGAVSAILQATAHLSRSRFNANKASVGAAVSADTAEVAICGAEYYNNQASMPGSTFVASTTSTITTCGLRTQPIMADAGSKVNYVACGACASLNKLI
eukprot:TRINITY_DN51825_c0_g1_i1.p1 TRINITY_DN51825_c0_g1~~TRINITY_DN51825_c0_g1_i1.p1  ORF type:complete len:379 (+),score=-18.39 TRINITY_DN51825_c0_g1_i1:258-1394(+)